MCPIDFSASKSLNQPVFAQIGARGGFVGKNRFNRGGFVRENRKYFRNILRVKFRVFENAVGLNLLRVKTLFDALFERGPCFFYPVFSRV